MKTVRTRATATQRTKSGTCTWKSTEAPTCREHPVGAHARLFQLRSSLQRIGGLTRLAQARPFHMLAASSPTPPPSAILNSTATRTNSDTRAGAEAHRNTHRRGRLGRPEHGG